MLRKWNATINLVSAADLPLLWPRHIEDSLQLGTIAGPLPPRAIDLGSGAGFPGLILAIAFGIEVDLIEQDQRKAAFLREAMMVTGAHAHVHAMKIERANVAARAVGRQPRSGAVAACCLAGETVADRRRILPVPEIPRRRSRKSPKRNGIGRCGSNVCPAGPIRTA